MTTIWPRTRSFAGRTAVLAARFCLREATLLHLLKLLALVGVYMFGIYVRIPGVVIQAGGRDTWWFRSLIDEVFTAGAFGRGAVFSLGNFAILGLCCIRPAPLLLVKRGIVIAAMACLCTILFASQGAVRIAFLPLAICTVCISAGGVLVFLIDKHLLRLRAPDVLHLNIFYWLVSSAWRDGRIHWFALPVPVVIALSAFYLFHDEKLIHVFNIKTKASARRAALALRSLNELSLETFAAYVMVFFVMIGGLISLLAGWRELGSAASVGVLSISVGTFVITMFVFGALRQKLSHVARPAIPEFGALVGPDPALIAHRVLDNYWIVEDIPDSKYVQAGHDTEAYLDQVVRRQWRKTLLLLSAWLAVAIYLDVHLRSHGINAPEFRYGALIYVALVTDAVTNLFMVVADLRARFNGFRHLQQGRLRVVDRTAPGGLQDHFLETAHRAASIEIDNDSKEYWSQEERAESLTEILNWYHLVRLEGRPPISTAQSHGKFNLVIRQVLLRLALGVVTASIAGFVYSFLKPNGDVWQVVIPLFVPALFTPEAFKMLGRGGMR